MKRVLERRQRGELGYRSRPPAVKNTEIVRGLVAKKVRASSGLITAKRLMPLAKAEGYRGSLRNLRREVARAKAGWRREQRRYRPWQPVAGEYLVADWAHYGRLHLFCAVLPWSRWRFVRFARDEKLETTLRMFAECFEALGGVPAVLLTDRMSCLKAGVVANMVVPHAEYVRFAAHYRFRLDFCEADDPESKGVVENLCGYAQRDLAALLESEDLELANQEAVRWCQEVNAHRALGDLRGARRGGCRSSFQLLRPLPSTASTALPGRAAQGRQDADRALWFRALLGAAGVSGAPGGGQRRREPGDHQQRRAGDCPASALSTGWSLHPRRALRRRPRRPSRPVRARTAVEREFVALGPCAEDFLRAGAAAGTTRLASELADIVGLERSWGREALVVALRRAVEFRRFRADDLRSILATNGVAPQPTPAGRPLQMPLPTVPVRPLSAYALDLLR